MRADAAAVPLADARETRRLPQPNPPRRTFRHHFRGHQQRAIRRERAVAVELAAFGRGQSVPHRPGQTIQHQAQTCRGDAQRPPPKPATDAPPPHGRARAGRFRTGFRPHRLGRAAQIHRPAFPPPGRPESRPLPKTRAAGWPPPTPPETPAALPSQSPSAALKPTPTSSSGPSSAITVSIKALTACCKISTFRWPCGVRDPSESRIVQRFRQLDRTIKPRQRQRRIRRQRHHHRPLAFAATAAHCAGYAPKPPPRRVPGAACQMCPSGRPSR